MAREGSTGHRLVPHTADLRIEAWAPTPEQCVAEAVRAMVRSFTDDVSSEEPNVGREFVVPAADAETELVSVLDEVIYRMDADNEIPQAVDVRREGRDLRVVLTMGDVTHVTVVGAVPKAVSLHQLRFAQDDENWRCTVTIDV
jgi:SHS2 domain-containing protein